MRADPAASHDAARSRGLLFVVKTTYTLRELQRETASAVHEAESGVRVTVTRHEKPVAHLILDERLGALLETLELSLYGGAVFTLVYASRESTRDVDGLIRPKAEGDRFARRVAEEQDLPADWLSDDVAQFLADREEKRRVLEDEFGAGLRVNAPTAAYLLALKLRASRPRLPGYAGDEADIEFLLRKIKPTSLADVEELFARFFPHDALPDRTKALVERVIRGTKK